jgi:hypothetical protein
VTENTQGEPRNIHFNYEHNQGQQKQQNNQPQYSPFDRINETHQNNANQNEGVKYPIFAPSENKH